MVRYAVFVEYVALLQYGIGTVGGVDDGMGRDDEGACEQFPLASVALVWRKCGLWTQHPVARVAFTRTLACSEVAEFRRSIRE